MRFADRYHAGRRLAAELERYRGENPVVPDDGLATGATARVGFWYQDFSPTSDEEVLECLRSAETGRVSA